jgi:hypothetical protein
MGDKELARLGKEAAAATEEAKTKGITPDTIGRVTQTTDRILERTRGMAEDYRDQGLTEDQIRQKIAEDIQNSR